jgi:hypothetical protein
MPPPQSEAAILSACLAYLTLCRVAHWRCNTGSTRMPSGRFVRFGTPGLPDIIAILPGGRFLGVEVKTRLGRVRPEQLAVHASITAAGGAVMVVRSLDDLVRGLAAHGVEP